MSYLLLIRPFNFCFVLLTVYYGAIFSKSITISWQIFFAMLSAAFIAGAGYVINDVFDLAIDTINKPKRVLPQGKISLKAAYAYAMFLFCCGIALSFFTGKWLNVGIAIFNSFLLFEYAKTYKMTFFMGNFIVSLTSASTFLYGGITNNNLKNGLLVAIFAFLYTFMRELVKDMEDEKADFAFSAKTIAIKWGKAKTTELLFLPNLLMLLYLGILFAFGLLNLMATSLLLIFVIIPLFISIMYMKKNPMEIVYQKISTFMKLDMIVLLLILVIG